jgi:hypothetical protein
MAQGVDGVTLPRFDVLDGHGDAQGWRGMAWTVSARWGRSRVPEEVVIVDWGSRAVPCGDQRGEGFNRGISIGLLLPRQCQPNRTKEKVF